MELRPSKKYPPFAANEKGEIVNLKTGNTRKQTVNKKNGYAYISTRQGLLLAHRIVADAFIPNPDNKEQVNHKNCVKTDNRPCNLEWVDRSANMIHAAQNNLLDTRNRKRGSECNLSHYSEEEVREVFKLLSEGRRNVDVSKITGIPVGYVKSLKLGHSWKHLQEQYEIPRFKRRTFSEATIRWICREIVNGSTNKEILSKCRNPAVKDFTIKNIKYGNNYLDISKEYF